MRCLNCVRIVHREVKWKYMYTNFRIKCKLWVLFVFFRDRGIQIILKKEKKRK